MPSERERNSAGMRVLTRREPLTSQDWVEMIEARLALIRPFLHKITLPKLGDLGKRRVFEISSLKEVYQDLIDNQAYFDLQGFFTAMDSRFLSEGDAKYHPLWGLTRSGDWLYGVGIEIPGPDGQWRKISLIIENQIKLERLLAKLQPDFAHPAEVVWCNLKVMIERATQDRLRLYEELNGIMDIIKAEEAVQSLVPLN